MVDTETNFAAERFSSWLAASQANLKCVAAGRSHQPGEKACTPGDVFAHDHGDRRSVSYGTLQWSRRRRGSTQSVREASTRQLYREGAQTEKQEEAGLAGTLATDGPANRRRFRKEKDL